MRKVLIGSAVILVVFAPVTASVAMADQPRPNSTSTPQAKDSDDSEDGFLGVIDTEVEDKLHHDLDKRYGKHGAFQIPPLVLKPESNGPLDTKAPAVEPVNGSASISGLFVPAGGGATGSGSASTSSTGNSTGIASLKVTVTDVNGNPVPSMGVQESTATTQSEIPATSMQVATTPIDFALIDLTQSTPADQFFRVASTSLAALAAGAIGLGATVGVRALRVARQERVSR